MKMLVLLFLFGVISALAADAAVILGNSGVILGNSSRPSNLTCGHFNRPPVNIIGGRNARRGEVPWQVLFGVS